MRTRTLLCLAALAVSATTAFSQTQSPSTAPESIPAPTQEPASSIPARPAPTAQQQQPAATTAPQQTPATPASPTGTAQARPAYGPAGETTSSDDLGSVFIPVDSWVYPAMTRLYSMGYLDTMFLGMRPWTRQSALHMLLQSKDKIVNSNDEQAQELLAKLLDELSTEVPPSGAQRGAVYGLQSAYTRVMGIGGSTLQDSFHLGQTLNNDYGRPYEPGFNNITGFSTANEWGRFSLYLRGEYQHAPSATGYPLALAQQLSLGDEILYTPPNAPQATIPEGPISSQNPFRIVEGSLSFHLLGHEISGGKSDAWLGPAQGGAMAWSNNAENIYSFRVDRVEPLHIPLISDVLGPVRYDFFYGSLKGHTSPNHPYVHSEMFSFRPMRDFEFGFQRTIIFGGAGHEPVTLHTFLHGFFNTSDTTAAVKYSRTDPGARFSDFNFSYRLPFVRRYATLYVDSISHDDVTPISAPRRAAYRTGLYISQFPGMPRLSFRAEAVTTDPGVSRSNQGMFNYWEVVQNQGYTNKGFIMGDWIGREAKGGQAWLTYQLSGNEWVQLEYLNKKTPKDFIADGTTQNQFKISVLKRITPDFELNSWYQYEGWKAPIYKPGLQKNSIVAVQLTWFPKLQTYLK
nr:capsule assembly Wzi family protein [Edaphobacter acidisoli]